MSEDPFKPIAGSERRAVAGDDKLTSILPVPKNAPAPPSEHYKRGAPTASWEYRDDTGRLLHVVARFDEADGKVVLPLAFCRSSRGATEWRWQSVAPPRPLYGLDRLAARPAALVIVAEGEKAADAAARLFPDAVATTSSGGSKAAAKADWSPLAGRDVVLWPDADEPGTVYLATAAKRIAAAGARSVAAIVPPAGMAEGWDAADAVKEGWSLVRVRELLAGAMPVADALARTHTDKPLEETEPASSRRSLARSSTRSRPRSGACPA